MTRGQGVGIAIVGAGVVGSLRARLLSREAGVSWLGIADIDLPRAKALGDEVTADFFTDDYVELLSRPEVDAVIVATPVSLHAGPVREAAARGHAMMIEKPLATDPQESADLLNVITEAGVDVVVGYSQRFRRRFLGAKGRIHEGALGDITTVMARVMMNEVVARATFGSNDDPTGISPMVVGGTHTIDLCRWMISAPDVSTVYAAANSTTFAELGTVDATAGVITFTDGTVFSIAMNWALPEVWPGSVYGLQVGVVGTNGVLDIEDTHRDVIVASTTSLRRVHGAEKMSDATRHVDFLGSYPPGELLGDDLWGPVRDETVSWVSRLLGQRETPHATARDAHENLILTMALDASARTDAVIRFPVEPITLRAPSMARHGT